MQATDFYDIGIDTTGGLVDFSPGDVVRQMKEVDTFLSTVNKDVENDVKKSGNQSFLQTWKGDVWAPWLSFYADFQNYVKTSPSRFRDSTYKRAEAYRQLAMRYRENLQKKMDSDVSAVKVPDPIKNPNKPAPKEQSDLVDTASSRNAGYGIPWKWIFGGLAVAGGGYLIYKNWPSKKDDETGEETKILTPAQAVPNPFGHHFHFGK